MKIWNNKVNGLFLLAMTLVLFNCTENDEAVQDTDKPINMAEGDSLTSEIEKDSLTEESLEDTLSTDSEEEIIQLTERFKPTSLDLIKSLKSNNELYIKLTKYHLQITQKEKVVNNLLLRQTLFAVRDECYAGQDLLLLRPGERNPLRDWIANIALEQMDREDRAGDRERFGVNELYDYIEANPNKVDNYDEEIVQEISISLDSCRKHWDED